MSDDSGITAHEALEDFISEEIEEYSHLGHWKIEETETFKGKVYFDVTFDFNSLEFRLTPDEGSQYNWKIEIDMNEDSWEEVVTYDWRVKYFWIKVEWK